MVAGLGSVADAEDVVQEALVRWHRHPNPAEIESPRAYLAQVTVRLWRRIETVALDIDAAGTISAIYVVSNPHKLRHIQANLTPS